MRAEKLPEYESLEARLKRAIEAIHKQGRLNCLASAWAIGVCWAWARAIGHEAWTISTDGGDGKATHSDSATEICVLLNLLNLCDPSAPFLSHHPQHPLT